MGMDIKQIQDLIKFVAKSGVNEVSIEETDFKITIKTNQEPTFVNASVVPQALPHPIQSPQALPAANSSETNTAIITDTSKHLAVKSPMIGTFYRSSSPDKPAFVSVGDEISIGQVVCVIEAMKLFNEIESEVAGRVVKVLVDNANPVEYDQPLFLIEAI
jgi:acetyl-CoA carboxylase biotin carboxyl carrier protein